MYKIMLDHLKRSLETSINAATLCVSKCCTQVFFNGLTILGNTSISCWGWAIMGVVTFACSHPNAFEKSLVCRLGNHSDCVHLSIWFVFIGFINSIQKRKYFLVRTTLKTPCSFLNSESIIMIMIMLTKFVNYHHVMMSMTIMDVTRTRGKHHHSSCCHYHYGPLRQWSGVASFFAPGGKGGGGKTLKK